MQRAVLLHDMFGRMAVKQNRDGKQQSRNSLTDSRARVVWSRWAFVLASDISFIAAYYALRAVFECAEQDVFVGTSSGSFSFIQAGNEMSNKNSMNDSSTRMVKK